MTTTNTKDTNSNKNGKVIGACCHLAGFLGGFIFPFGGIVFSPLVWGFGAFIANVDEEEMGLLNNHGKEALNFRLSLGLYLLIALFIMIGLSIVAAIIGLQTYADPVQGLAFGFSGGIAGGMALSMILTTVIIVFDFICVLRATIHAFQGKKTRYPLTIHFLK